MKIEDASAKVISAYLCDMVTRARRNERIIGEKAWSEVYGLVFSDAVSRVIYGRFPDFDPYIPDSSYEEDVVSFVQSFETYADGSMCSSEWDSGFWPLTPFEGWCGVGD